MAAALKCGIYLPNFGAFGDARLLADLAADAEAAGWDGFFIWDHIARPFATEMVDPWVALTAIALRTTRVRIGALVTPLPRRRPWKVAREAVAVDRVSGGRLVLGAGSGSQGGRDVEWAGLGEEMDLKARGTMLDEGLAIVAGLTSGEPFAFEGRHYRIARTRFLPPALQAPRIPVWIGGTWSSPPPWRRAARWDGAFPWFGFRDGESESVAKLAAVVERVRALRTASGPYDVVYATRVRPDDPRAAAEALATYADAGATWWLERIEPQFFGATWEGRWPLERMRAHVRGGPPRRVAPGSRIT
jgi:alkanesulfonate monooxygenase SsuD/methylene tetrahydromethanopterin reductase-like flavin-dependent oxidoreductase (luciferase family)